MPDDCFEVMAMAGERRQQKKRKVEIGFGQILIGVIVSVVVVLFSFTTFYEVQELKVLDERFKLRNWFFGLPYAHPHIAMIEVDDRALEAEGRWQDWTRNKFAELVDALSQFRARMVGFDVFFPEPSAKVAMESAAREVLDSRDQISREEVLQLFNDYDEIFRQSLERAGNVYLGQTFEVVERDTVFTGVKPRSPEYDERFKALAPFYRDYPTWEQTRIKRCLDLTAPPLKPHIEAAKGVGFVQTVPDPDGTRRRYQLVMVYDGKLVPSLAVLMLCDDLRVPFTSLEVVPGEYLRFPNAHMPDGRVIDLRVPMDEEGRMYVNWVGTSKEGFSRYPHS
ncbi:MAG: CHASE2 domain-containing protein, partial [Candidatus Latescibacteria bacterium]|nr:CHASE2 domain-containing protein [Candidatus Latescibacterota bacterium]